MFLSFQLFSPLTWDDNDNWWPQQSVFEGWIANLVSQNSHQPASLTCFSWQVHTGKGLRITGPSMYRATDQRLLDWLDCIYLGWFQCIRQYHKHSLKHVSLFENSLPHKFHGSSSFSPIKKTMFQSFPQIFPG